MKKEAVEKETKKQQLRADKLEQLSRTLQTERSNLIQELKQYGESKLSQPQAVINNSPPVTSEQQVTNEAEAVVNNNAQTS